MQRKRFLLLFSLPLLLAGCSEDGINDGVDYFPGQNGDIVFDIGFAPQTRVSTGADFSSAWEYGDEIGVYAVAHGEALASSGNYIHNAKLTYSSADGGSWGQEPPLYWPNNGGKLDFYAYYPYDDNATDPTAIAFNVKADQSGETGGKSNYNLSDLLTAKSDNGDGWAKGSTVGLTFSHALSMVQLTIEDEVGALDVNEDIVVVLRNIRTGCKLNLGAPEATTDGDAANITMYRVEQPDDADYTMSFTFRALVPAQTLAQGSSLFFISNGDLQLTGSAITADLTMTAGQAETFTQEIPSSLVVTRPEANSYMLRPNGVAILIPVSQANRVLTADGLGAETTGLGGVTANNFTVELVWGDLPVGAGGVLTEMRAEELNGKGYVYVKPGVEGNAVICIKVGGVIKWSWHIWVTEQVTSKTDGVTGLKWMDRNLGAKSNTPLVNGAVVKDQWIKTFGLYYQWGRKDAFPGSDGTNNNQTYYTGSNTDGTTARLSKNNSTDLPSMVQNPLTFVMGVDYYGSLNAEGDINDSWGGVSGKKTLYDPCPRGWKVPPIEVNGTNSWGSSTTDNNKEWTFKAYPAEYKGAIFKGVNGTAALNHWFSTAGQRSVNTGHPYLVNHCGHYWSSTPYSTNDGYDLLFYSSMATTTHKSNRSRGSSVRCVAE